VRAIRNRRQPDSPIEHSSGEGSTCLLRRKEPTIATTDQRTAGTSEITAVSVRLDAKYSTCSSQGFQNRKDTDLLVGDRPGMT